MIFTKIPSFLFFFLISLQSLPYGECTLLKTKEIQQLQTEIDNVKTSVLRLEMAQPKIFAMKEELKELIEAEKKHQCLTNIEMIESRLTTLELRIMNLEAPGTPGSLGRRTATRRPSAQRVPTISSRGEEMSYFSPASPYSA